MGMFTGSSLATVDLIRIEDDDGMININQSISITNRNLTIFLIVQCHIDLYR